MYQQQGCATVECCRWNLRMMPGKKNKPLEHSARTTTTESRPGSGVLDAPDELLRTESA